MTMDEHLLAFLKMLETECPPELGHHSITYARYGSDSEGWEDKLALNVRQHNGSQTFFLDSGDLEKPPQQLVGEIRSLLETSREESS